MRLARKRGATSVLVPIHIPDNSSTTGAGLTGLTSASTNLTIEYRRELDSAVVSYSGANIEAQTTIGTYQAPSSSSKIRFKETPIAGTYELQFHDSATAFGTGDASQSIQINIREATTTALHIGPNGVLIPLVPNDYQDATRGTAGTALPAVAAEAAGGLYTRGTGAGQLSQSANGELGVATLAKTLTTNSDKTGYAIASGGIGAGAHAAAELNAMADAVLDRNMTTGTDSGTDSGVVRTVRQALRRLRNKESIAAGVGTVCKEDDSTPSWTYAATTAAGNPLTGVDPT